MAWGINDAIDQIEATMREANSSYYAVEKHNFYRKLMTKGLSKGFHHGLNNVAISIAIRSSSQELAENGNEITEMVSMIVGMADQTN